MFKRLLMPIIISFCLPTAVFADSFVKELFFPVPPAGAVFTMTNSPIDNELVIFTRNSSGMLTKAGNLSTHGLGSGGKINPLASQGAIHLIRQSVVLVANAGSDEISVFEIRTNGIAYLSKINTGGHFPVSITTYQNLIYVLNAASHTINAFRLHEGGTLSPVLHSERYLGAGEFSQIEFSPKGTKLIAINKTKNKIFVFAVDKNGLLSQEPVITASNAQTPFGTRFGFGQYLLVTEARTGSLSSYELTMGDNLKTKNKSIISTQSGNSWIDGNQWGYFYTSNTLSNTISSYQIDEKTGNLSLLNAVAATGNQPIDLAISKTGVYLYVLNAGAGTIGMFKMEENGRLTNLGTITAGVPIYAQGLAVR